MERNSLTEINDDDFMLNYHENESNKEFESRIEEVLSSKGRILILKTLAEMEELNISAIARVTNLNHNTTSQHLEFLTKVGLVQEKRFGRIKIFRFRSENIRARSLKKLFEIWK
ncbi:MAG TPA: winged helix-turn-helix domain-containing protein [Candidatus Bathyarchaeia archaeon]|nr:winged helix-turn-helix domain-containing protein [Candidatus Bathyarchaeia archaeon]